MNKLQIKIFMISISVGICIIAWCQAIEFLVKYPQSQFDIMYLGYTGVGFFVLCYLAYGMIRPPKNPIKSKFPHIIILFAIISICFLLLYNPFFTCLRDGGVWQFAKGCITDTDE